MKNKLFSLIFLYACLFVTDRIKAQFNTADIAIAYGPDISLSENSVFIHPADAREALNANIYYYYFYPSTNDPPFISVYASQNAGITWYGTEQVHAESYGDPAVVITPTGRYIIGYVNYINNYAGQAITCSDDKGQTWHTPQQLASPPSAEWILDKNHLWVDDREKRSDGNPNPYYGYIYNAWTPVKKGVIPPSSIPGEPSDPPCVNNEVSFTHSADDGISWQPIINISAGIQAGCYNQGVNIQSGPDGEVYACWAIFDSEGAGPSAFGFNKSSDGGQSWSNAWRIRNENNVVINPLSIGPNDVLNGGKEMKLNSFPSMTVNMQNAELYIVWTMNISTSSTPETDIYMIKSTDQGNTWSDPARVNQDQGNADQWFPWIACDEASGSLVVIYYDSRNFANNNRVETFVSISHDDGVSWTDYQISKQGADWDGNGLNPNSNYAGDYLGIDASHGLVYPVWGDKRTDGYQMLAYTQPFFLCPENYYLCDRNIDYTWNYSASNSIAAGGLQCQFTVQQGADVVMQAENSVLMKTGFKVEVGSHFVAKNIPCGPNNFRIMGSNNENADTLHGVYPLLKSRNLLLINPNPNTGRFTVEWRGSGIGELSICNLFGQEVYRDRIPAGSTAIDLGRQAAGMYFLSLRARGGSCLRKLLVR